MSNGLYMKVEKIIISLKFLTKNFYCEKVITHLKIECFFLNMNLIFSSTQTIVFCHRIARTFLYTSW